MYIVCCIYIYIVRPHMQVPRDQHVSSSSYDMYPPPHMTCILLLIYGMPSYAGTTRPTCILLLI